MEAITKYEYILGQINAEIESFNSLLVQFRFELLDASSPGSWLIVANVPWKELNLGLCPHGDCPGLYVLCAYQKDNPTRLGAYVGKSSLGTIGNRVGSNLYNYSPGRANGIYTMNSLEGQTFIIEAVIASGVRERRMRVLASALEEFVIDGVQDKFPLLNNTGVER